MKIVNILGGIGNQMFQYAFLVALRESTNCDVYYDSSVFKTYNLHNGFELERCFKISIKQASKSDINRLSFYTESYFLYRLIKHFPLKKSQKIEPNYCEYNENLLFEKDDYYYYGIWQNYKYFDKYRDVLLNEFSWKLPLDDRNSKAYLLFKENDTVSIHVRRGDYLKEWRYKNICELDYYIKALKYLKEHIHKKLNYAIFSNDMQWCRQNLVPLLLGADYVLVDWNTGQSSSIDMRLMSACKINVIANSSFSWWAAYLNCHNDSLVISPQKWTNAKVLFNRQLPNWVLL